MKNYVYKVKSSGEYISESENYIVIMLATFIRLYDVRTKKTIKINIKDISHVYISRDDRFMILSKSYSPYIYLYDLIVHEIVIRKSLDKNAVISYIHSDKNGNAIICAKYTCHINRCLLYIFYYKEGQFQRIDNNKICDLIHLYGAVYKIMFNDKELKKGRTCNCEIIDGEIKEIDYIENFDTFNCQIEFSKDQKYYYIAENYIIDKDSGYSLDENKSQMTIYKKNKELFKLSNRRSNSGVEVLANIYRGKFTKDNEGNSIFYTYYNQKISLYYLEKEIVKEIEIEMPAFNFYISFIHDYLLINNPNISYSFCYIYSLHELL